LRVKSTKMAMCRFRPSPRLPRLTAKLRKCPTSPRQRGYPSWRLPAHGARVPVAVSVQGEGDSGVPQHLRHYLRMGSLSQQQRCSGMPQIMEADTGQAGTCEDLLEGAGYPARVQWSAGRVREHKIINRSRRGYPGLSPGEERRPPFLLAPAGQMLST
jgi:hypothetical protein